MKVSSEHVTALRDAIAPLDTDFTRAAYRTGQFPRAELVKDLDMRYRWDLFYAVKGVQIVGAGRYMDAHIDTALRSIIAPLSS